LSKDLRKNAEKRPDPGKKLNSKKDWGIESTAIVTTEF